MRKNKKIKKVNNFSYDDRIKELEYKIELLKEMKEIHSYFSKIEKNRNSILVEMKVVIYNQLIERGIKNSEIARALSQDHSSALRYKELQSTKHIKQLVFDNYKQWMKDRVYPCTTGSKLVAEEKKNSFVNQVTFVLKPLLK